MEGYVIRLKNGTYFVWFHSPTEDIGSAHIFRVWNPLRFVVGLFLAGSKQKRVLLPKLMGLNNDMYEFLMTLNGDTNNDNSKE